MVDALTSLTSLVTERVFQVPDYQRGYAWTKNERQDLLDDLEEIRTIQSQYDYEHYTGTIVLNNTGQQRAIPGGIVKVVDIVDGQQRLTTLVILLRQFIIISVRAGSPLETKPPIDCGTLLLK